MEKIVIVGGGIAGLSCLNALLDSGISPLLIEGQTIGTPKLCGEFLAPAAVSLLNKWEIDDIYPIEQADFLVKNKKLNFVFPKIAGASSRSEMEFKLARRATKKGGRIIQNSLIQKIEPRLKNSPFRFHLQSGEIIESQTAIFASGKVAKGEKLKPIYSGIKIHFPTIVKKQTLLMFSLPNAYLGIVPISDTISNCTCLIKNNIHHQEPPEILFKRLIQNNKQLKNIFPNLEENTGISWLSGISPEFGFKNPPNWQDAFWIGDAFGSIYPAIGSGFANSVLSANLAVKFYLENNQKSFHTTSKKYIRKKLRIGKFFHTLLLHPRIASLLLFLVKRNPWMATRIGKNILI